MNVWRYMGNTNIIQLPLFFDKKMEVYETFPDISIFHRITIVKTLSNTVFTTKIGFANLVSNELRHSMPKYINSPLIPFWLVFSEKNLMCVHRKILYVFIEKSYVCS